MEPIPPRPSWAEYFLDIAHTVRTRSTCPRAPGGGIGAVLVSSERRIISTGYAGSVRRTEHCTQVGCDIDPLAGGCRRTVHAEQNAIIDAARHGEGARGAHLYCTLSPCWTCAKLLVQAGVASITYRAEYRTGLDELRRLCDATGVVLLHLPTPDARTVAS